MEEQKPFCLKNISDSYNTRYINDKDLPQDATTFSTQLKSTIEVFQSEKVKGVYLEISFEKSELLSVAREQGFELHHTQDNYITLQKWLPNSKCRLPAYSTHYIGVGGLVIDFEQRKVLLIQEKQGNNTASWKVPGGLVDTGEYLSEAVEREVREETGVEAEFRGVINLREKKGYNFGRNDIYFLCLLVPKTTSINMCEVEIEKCVWMDIDEWKAQKFEVQAVKITCETAYDLIEEYRKGKEAYLDHVLVDKEVVLNLPKVKMINTIYVRNKYRDVTCDAPIKKGEENDEHIS